MALKKSHNPITWQYIAGFFDGEGSIFATKQIRKDKRIACRIHISLTNTNTKVMEAISKFSGLKLHRTAYRNKKYGRVRIDIKETGIKAANFLKKIKPYSISKRKQVQLALKFATTIRNKKNPRTRVLQKELKNREKIRNKVKKLNKGKYYAT